MAIVSVNNLTFDYPGTRALDDVSFEVPQGAIVALVGPNGSGKTTLLSCLAALVTPFAGEISINDVDALEEPRLCHRQVGYLADFFGLYQELTVEQSLRYACRIHDVRRSEEDRVIRQTAERLAIADRMHMKAGALSRGLRQRLAIAQTIVHEPTVLLLDEPASGLDPEARLDLSKLFIELQQAGMTLIVSSHILAELEQYSTDMLVLSKGKIVERTLIRHAPVNQVNLLVRCLAPVAGIEQCLAQMPDVQLVSAEGNTAILHCQDDNTVQHDLLQHLLANGYQVYSFTEERVNMQDAYLETLRKH
jgi:ABC-2 type transport system ATP-binding protein